MADGRYPNLILVIIDLGDLCLYGERFLVFFFLRFPCVGVPIRSQIWKCCFYLDTFPSHNYLVISLCITQPVVCPALGFGFSLGSPSCISISLSFCQIRPFALSTYNSLHHSICIHSSLISFSVYNSCGLLTQRPALGQIRILFVFSVGSPRPTVSFLSQQCPILLFTPASTALCSFDYHSHRCGLRKYRCLINTDLAAYLTQSLNKTQSLSSRRSALYTKRSNHQTLPSQH